MRDREVKRRTDVVGLFSDDRALLRLAACVPIEARDQWYVSGQRYGAGGNEALLTSPESTVPEPRRDHPDG